MSARCASCGAEIRWAISINVKPMPLDRVPDPERGSLILLEGEARAPLALTLTNLTGPARAAAERHGVDLYVTHFATCPSVAEHRRS